MYLKTSLNALERSYSKRTPLGALERSENGVQKNGNSWFLEQQTGIF
jgi:hypothetical protein